MPDDDLDQMDGSALRRKLEDALAANKALSTQNAEYKANDVIRTKNFTLVKPEDLKGIPADQIEAKAEALYKERRDLQAELAKDLLRKQGIPDDELDQAVEDFLSGSAPVHKTEAEDVAGRLEAVRALGQQSGTPVSHTPVSDLHGLSAIEHGLTQGRRRAN